MNIYVIIPVYNRIHYTKKIISCLRSQTLRNNIKIIVVDDGSTEGTGIWLKKQNDIETLKGNGKLLWAGAVNLAIKNIFKKNTQNDWILLINNDGWPTPTGTPCPAFPQVPIPGSNIISFPTIETSFRADGPSPIKVAPLIGEHTFPFIIS